ncbi:TetR/AcrR family transcriptional regulator [Streptococcus caprae]|uniref:TetR/AcrR family transcriptional regulator n=1 Tax=Streptococcus caprae TaxID=1640501 RepID=A0ABV8CW15_9STRE
MADNRKHQTRRKLEMALSELLSKQNFNQITIQEIARLAGVSRGGFYTHFHDKYDLIEQYQARIFDQLEGIFAQQEIERGEIFRLAFVFLQEEPLAASLLSPNGTSEIQLYFIAKFRQLIIQDAKRFRKLKHLDDQELIYGAAYFSNALFGYYQTWLVNGMKESPEEMTSLLLTLLPDR